MYNLYLLSFKLLHAIGLKKTSVRLARHMEKYARQPLDNSKLYDAVWMFFTYGQSFPSCENWMGYGCCYMPVLSDDDPFHKYCREAFAEEEARHNAEVDAYLDSRCKQHGCWEDAVKDGYCQSDWDYNHLCGEPGCDKLYSECGGTCVPDVTDEPYSPPYDVLLDDEDDQVSTTTVYSRAYSHFGNHEMAREATEMYPGDFI
jgi:hypothetical protein